MRIPTVCLAIALSIALAGADQEMPGASADLASAGYFAFGRIGVAGRMSENEGLFHEVMAGPDARKRLLDMLRKGTPAAQCYALVGLRAVDRARFDEEVKRFESSTAAVRTVAGCLISDVPMRSVVANIRSGAWDAYATPGPRL